MLKGYSSREAEKHWAREKATVVSGDSEQHYLV